MMFFFSVFPSVGKEQTTIRTTRTTNKNNQQRQATTKPTKINRNPPRRGKKDSLGCWGRKGRVTIYTARVRCARISAPGSQRVCIEHWQSDRIMSPFFYFFPAYTQNIHTDNKKKLVVVGETKGQHTHTKKREMKSFVLLLVVVFCTLQNGQSQAVTSKFNVLVRVLLQCFVFSPFFYALLSIVCTLLSL